MALRWIDSFDNYSTAQIPRKYDANASGLITASQGRRSTSCFEITFARSFTKVLDSQQTWVVGFAMKWASTTTVIWPFLTLQDAGTTQVDVRFDTSGHVIVTRNGTTLGTSATTVSAATFHYIEFKCKIDGTVGTYDVVVDGVNILTGTGANTKNTANSTADRVIIGCSVNGPGTTYVDDLYICDGTGSVNKDFLGDCRVDAVNAASNGTNTGLTPSTGTNHAANVDDMPSNDDTDYNASNTATTKDTYNMVGISHNPVSIFGVFTNMTVKKDDGGLRKIKDVVRSAGTDYDGSSEYVLAGSSYQMFRQLHEVDPATSAAWTKANLNAAEFGMKVSV